MAENKGCFKVALEDGDGNAGCLDLLNPEGADVIIYRVFINVTTEATGGARTLNVGVGAEGADLANIIDASAAAATGTLLDMKTEDDADSIIWEDGDYLTVTPSADAEGQVADLYVQYIRA